MDTEAGGSRHPCPGAPQPSGGLDLPELSLLPGKGLAQVFMSKSCCFPQVTNSPCCVFDTAQAPTVCLWSLGPSLSQPWRRRGEAPVSRRLSWVPGSPWSLEAALLASPVAPPYHPAPAVTSRQPPLLRMGTRVGGGLPMETLDQNNQPGSGASPCRAVAAP